MAEEQGEVCRRLGMGERVEGDGHRMKQKEQEEIESLYPLSLPAALSAGHSRRELAARQRGVLSALFAFRGAKKGVVREALKGITGDRKRTKSTTRG
jgi:hypothetical protein